jgi:NAD(P)H-nitrite reductase large subunit
MSYKNLLEERPDYVVCVCMTVLRSELVSAIKRGNLTFDALQQELMVGMGCSSCHEEVQAILLQQRDKCP